MTKIILWLCSLKYLFLVQQCTNVVFCLWSSFKKKFFTNIIPQNLCELECIFSIPKLNKHHPYWKGSCCFHSYTWEYYVFTHRSILLESLRYMSTLIGLKIKKEINKITLFPEFGILLHWHVTKACIGKIRLNSLL